jgi:hypothetical protein
LVAGYRNPFITTNCVTRLFLLPSSHFYNQVITKSASPNYSGLQVIPLSAKVRCVGTSCPPDVAILFRHYTVYNSFDCVFLSIEVMDKNLSTNTVTVSTSRHTSVVDTLYRLQHLETTSRTVQQLSEAIVQSNNSKTACYTRVRCRLIACRKGVSGND